MKPSNSLSNLTIGSMPINHCFSTLFDLGTVHTQLFLSQLYRRYHLNQILIFTLFAAFMVGTASAQQTITYTNGANDSSPIAITSATNPTTLTIASGNATQSGIISQTGGSYAVAKAGAGLLMLTGTNTYTSLTTISAGDLAIGAGGSIADSSEVSLASSGTTFDISAGGSQTIQTLNGVSGSTVNLGANTLTDGTGGYCSWQSCEPLNRIPKDGEKIAGRPGDGKEVPDEMAVPGLGNIKNHADCVGKAAGDQPEQTV